jgi:DNA modification methylase
MLLLQGDCLQIMPTLAPASVDLILCDLPYGTTNNKWDTIIHLDALWAAYSRVARGAIVLTAAQPFTSALVMSNREQFKYQWIWEKNKSTGHLDAKRRPMRAHEDVLVFGKPIYNPQMGTGKAYSNSHKPGDSGDCYGAVNFSEVKNCETRYPRSVIKFDVDIKAEFHPTQKPVALMEYLIKTYTNPGDTVLDNCMGSGTTGVACVNTGREFIGIEQDPNYFQIASTRIAIAEYEKACR